MFHENSFLGKKVSVPKEFLYIMTLLYPNFTVKREGFPEFVVGTPGINYVYYVKDANPVQETNRIVHYLKKVNKRRFTFVSHSSVVAYDYDLNDRELLLEAVTEVRGMKSCPKTLQKKFISADPFIGWNFLKMSVALNKWTNVFLSRKSPVKMFKVLFDSKKEFTDLFLKACKTENSRIVFSRILAYLEKTEQYNEKKEDLSAKYRVLVKQGTKQKMNVSQALISLLAVDKEIDKDLRFLHFLLSLRGADTYGV